MTIDRFSEIYPSLSPYQYARNNPLLFIDVNGDSTRETTDPEARAKGIQFEETDATECIANSLTQEEQLEFGLLSSSERPDGNQSWLDKKWPLATPNDSWIYQFIRGTGNFQQDLNSFTIGVPAISFIAVGTAATGTYTYVMYGDKIVGIISTSLGTLQRGYVWSTLKIQAAATQTTAIYLTNAEQINNFLIGFSGGVGVTGAPRTGASGWAGYWLGFYLKNQLTK